jgi:hypothetical protein
MMTIHWQGNRTQVTARIDGYALRAWKTKSGEWRWDVKKWIQPIAEWKPIDAPLTTRAAAQRAAENAMNEHINKQQQPTK